MSIQVEKGDTLWGIAKRSVQAQTGAQKVTNQQIVDEMNKIATDNGYDSVDDCVKDNFYAKNGKLGSLQVQGLEVEHSEDEAAEDIDELSEDIDGDFADEGMLDGEQLLEYTTLGAGGTFAAKTAIKVGKEVLKSPVVKSAVKKGADAAKKAATKLKGKVDAAKVKRARNSQAAKIRDARKAADAAKSAKNTLKAEQAKLASLKRNKASKEAIAAQEKAVAKAKKNSAKATEAMKAKRKAAGLNQRTGQPLKKKRIVKTPGGKVAKASAKKAATKTAAKKAAAKTAGKAVTKKAAAKAAGKTLLKKIPGVGLLCGLAFAADRAMHGDWAGAAGEVASGAVSCVPGIGTAASVAIDAGLMYRDIKSV